MTSHTGTRKDPLHQSDIDLDDTDYRPMGRDDAVWAKTVMGSAIHRVLEAGALGEVMLYQEAWNECVRQETEAGRELVYKGRYRTEGVLEERALRILSRYQRPWELPYVQVVGSEMSFLLCIDGIWFTGTCDLVLRVNGKLALLDYKTGKKIPDLALSVQHHLYCYAALRGEWTHNTVRIPGQHQIDVEAINDWEPFRMRSMPMLYYHHLDALAEDSNAQYEYLAYHGYPRMSKLYVLTLANQYLRDRGLTPWSNIYEE